MTTPPGPQPVRSPSDPKPIGICDFCGGQIVAPADVLVWVEDRSYHQACYQAHLARRMTDEGIRPAI